MPTEKDDENIFKNDNDNNHNNIVTADCWRRLAPGRGSPARSMSALCFTHSRAQKKKKKVIDDGDGDDDGDAIHPTTSLTQPWKWLWFFFCPGRGWCANLFEKMIHVLFFIFFSFLFSSPSVQITRAPTRTPLPWPIPNFIWSWQKNRERPVRCSEENYMHNNPAPSFFLLLIQGDGERPGRIEILVVDHWITSEPEKPEFIHFWPKKKEDATKNVYGIPSINPSVPRRDAVEKYN